MHVSQTASRALILVSLYMHVLLQNWNKNLLKLNSRSPQLFILIPALKEFSVRDIFL